MPADKIDNGQVGIGFLRITDDIECAELGQSLDHLGGVIKVSRRAELLGQFDDAFALGMLTSPVNTYALTIGIGAWLGTIMLFNVWVLIWPNQKKVLGMVEASADQVAKAKNIAFMASRSNTLMSIPMIMSMVGAGHGWAI